MNQTQNQTQINNTNEIEIKKRVYFFMHEDGFKGKDLEPLILVDNEKIYATFLKRTVKTNMYYIFDYKKYLKLWSDSKNNLLIYFDNWNGDLFISNQQTTEYIDRFNYIAGGSELVCENNDDIRKTIKLEGFDILPLTINQFSRYEKAIFYIICNKLS